MTASIIKTRILVVDTSTAMLHVLKIFSDKHGYEPDCCSDPAQACVALGKRFEKFDSDYRCVLVGWPEGSPVIINEMLDKLSSADHQDLPLVVVCQEMTNEIKNLVKRRARTRALLWKDYRSAADIIDRLAIVASAPKTTTDAKKAAAGQTSLQSVNSSVTPPTPVSAKKVLLLDSAPSVCRELRDMMEANGYYVSVAGNIEEGRKACESEYFDLVVTDFSLRGECGDEFCRYLNSGIQLPGRVPVCIVLTSKLSDAIVKRSLAVGAIACLYKDESTEILFARINALVRVIPIANDRTSSVFSTDQMLELSTRPAVLVDNQGRVAGLNKQADSLLDDASQQNLIGQPFTDSICRTPVRIGAKQEMRFRLSSGNDLAVSCLAQKIDIKGREPGTLVTFTVLAGTSAIAEPAEPLKISTATAIVKATSNVSVEDHAPIRLPDTAAETKPADDSNRYIHEPIELPANANAVNAIVVDESEAQAVAAEEEIRPVIAVEEFKQRLNQCLQKKGSGARQCVLLLDIKLIAITDDRLSIGHSEPMLKIVYRSLARLYTLEDSFYYLGDGQFAFLLSTRRTQDALVLTRKLLQIVPLMVKYLSNMTLLSHGALIQLNEDTVEDADLVLERCRKACARTQRDQRDNTALVLPVNKYLSPEASKIKSIAGDVTAG